MSTTYPQAPAAGPTPASRETAESIRERANILRRRVYDLLRRESLTTHEIASRLTETVPAVQPRVSELKTRGLIDETGERRLNAASGKPASVYRALATPKAPKPPKPGSKAYWRQEAMRLSAEVARLRQEQQANASRPGPVEQLDMLEMNL